MRAWRKLGLVCVVALMGCASASELEEAKATISELEGEVESLEESGEKMKVELDELAAKLESMESRQASATSSDELGSETGGNESARRIGMLVPLEPFVVNLLDPANLRYVNCRVELEVEDGPTVKEIKRREAQIRDVAIELLSNQPYEDVLGAAGKSRIREEMLVRFNRVLRDGQISRVYITEFVVQ